MKKSLKTVMAVILAGFALATTGCVNAIVDDGTHPIDYAAMSKKKASGIKGGAADADTVGESWGALFSNGKHSPIDLQIWADTFEATPDSTNGLVIASKSTWVGGAVVQKGDKAAGDAGCVYYDMSKVVKMTYEAKASSNGLGLWATYTGTDKAGIADAEKKPVAKLTTEWQTVTVTKQGCANAFSPLVFAADENTCGRVLTSSDKFCIRNVTYYDASGNSVAIKYAN